MADVESNINVNIDTSNALASIKRLQAEISKFHQQMATGGAASAAASAQLQQGLVNSINATGNFSASMKTISSATESFTNSLEKNKFSMGEYFRYAGASTKTFGRLFSSEFDTINKVARERVKDLQTQYIKLGRDANGAMRSIAVRPLTLDMNDLGTQTAITAQKQQIFNQLMKQGSTNLLNFGKNTQWAGRQLMVGFTVPLTIMGAAAAREFKNIEEQVIRFKRVYGDAMTSTAETDAMANNLKTLASEFTQYGISVANTMKLAADAAAMGKTGAELTAQVAQANRLSALGNVDQQQALATTTSLTSTFSIATKDLAKNINFLNAVENQTVTSIEDLTTAIPTAAPVIKQLGGDVQDLAFFLTAMREGGINASEGANALKSGLASMINPTAQATAMLQGFGINLQGIMDKDKGNVKQMVIDLGNALNSLDPTNRAQAIEQMFGKFQFARMSTLFQNVTKEGTQAARVLDLTNQSSAQLAILSERELKKVSDSPLYKFQKALEDFQAALAPVGEAFLKAITPIIEWGKKVLDWFNGWNDQAKNIGVVLTIAIAGLGPVLLMAFGLISNGAANIIKMFMGLRNMFIKAGGGSKILGEQLGYMTQEQLQAATVAASLDQAHNKLIQTFTSESSAVGQLIAQYQAAVVAQNKFMSASGNVAGKTRTPVKKADGGIINGPGTGTSDSIPAMLSNGEAIIPAKTVAANMGLIQSLIAGNVPKYSKGGVIGNVAKYAFGGIAGMLKRARLSTTMDSKTLIEMLLRGDTKYRSGLETGTGLDLVGNPNKPRRPGVNERNRKVRELFEEKVFGIAPSAGPEGRVTFASVATTSPMARFLNRLLGGKVAGKQFNQVTDLMSDKLSQYGDISLIGKRGLSRKATVFHGDTFPVASHQEQNPHVNLLGGPGGTPAPMIGANKKQLDYARFSGLTNPYGWNRKTGPDGFSFMQDNRMPSYIEGQIIGGFSLKDIKTIIARNPEMIPLIEKALLKQGLRTKVRSPRTGWLQKLLGYANGGIISGPGTGTSDSIPAMLSNGEAVISADIVKKYPGLVQGLIGGKVSHFAKSGIAGKSKTQERTLGYTNAVLASPKKEFGGVINEKIMDPKAALGEVRDMGIHLFAPVIENLARSLGATTPAQIQKMVEEDPRLIQFAREASKAMVDGVAEVASSGATTMSDKDISAIGAKAARTAAKATKLEAELDQIESEITAVDDVFEGRVSYDKKTGKPKQRSGGRSQLRVGADAVTPYNTPGRRKAFVQVSEAMERVAPGEGRILKTGEFHNPHFIQPVEGQPADWSPRSQLGERAKRSQEALETGQKSVYLSGDSAIRAKVPIGAGAKEAAAALEKAKERGKKDAEAYSDAKEKALDKPENDNYEQARQRKSPHKKAKPDGIDDAKAYDEGRSQALSDRAKKGWETRRAKAAQPQMESYTRLSDVTRMVGTNAAIFASKSLVNVGKGFQNLKFILDKTMLDIGYNMGRAKDIVREASVKIYNGLFKASEAVVGAAFKVTTSLQSAAKATASFATNIYSKIMAPLTTAATATAKFATNIYSKVIGSLASAIVATTNFGLSIYSKIVPALTNATVSIMRFGESIAIKLINAFSTAQVALVKFAGPTFFKLVAALTTATTATTNFATNLYSKVSTALIAATTATTNFATSIYSKVVTSLTSAAVATANFGLSLYSKIVPALATATVSILKFSETVAIKTISAFSAAQVAIVKFAGPTFFKLIGALNNATTSVVKFATNIYGKVVGPIATASNIISRFGATVGKMIALPLLRATPSIIRFGGAVSINLMKAFNVAYGGVVRFGSALVNNTIKALGNATNAVIRFGATVATPLVKAFTVVKTKVASAIAPITTAVSGAFTATSTRVKSIADGIKSKVSGAFEGLKDKMSSSTSKMANRVSEGVSKAGTAFSAFIDKVKAKVNTLAASPYVGVTQTGQRDMSKKERKAAEKAAAAAKAQRSQRLAGMGSMASMGLMMGSSMLPPEAGAAGSIIGATAMGASMGSMLGPWGTGIGAALGLVSSSAMAVNDSMNEARNSALAFGNALGAGTKSMEGFASFTGNVTDSQIKDRERKDIISGKNLQGVKKENMAIGGQFLETDQGKAMVDSIGKNLKNVDMSTIQEQLFQQMSTAIATGAMDQQTAQSIVQALGEKLGDPSMALQVNAKIMNLFDRDGKKLSDSKLEILAEISKESSQNIKNEITTLTADLPNVGLNWAKISEISGLVVSMGVQTIEQQKELLDSLDVEYQKRLQIAKANGENTTELTKQYETSKQQNIDNQQQTRDALLKPYKEAVSGPDFLGIQSGQMGQAMDTMIQNKYQNDPIQQALAKKASEAVGANARNYGGAENYQLEYQVKTIMAEGDIPPEAFIKLLDGTDKEGVTAQNKFVVDITAKYGSAEGGMLVQIASQMADKTLQGSFEALITEDTTNAPFFESLYASGGTEAVTFAVNLETTNQDAFNDLKKDITDIDDLFADGKKKTYQQILDARILNPAAEKALKASSAWFDGLDAVSQKFAMQYFVEISASMDDSDVAAWLNSKTGGTKGKNGQIYGKTKSLVTEADRTAYLTEKAKNATDAFTAANADNAGNGPDNGDGGGGGGGEAARTIADVIADQDKRITATQNQAAAVKKLTAAGLSLADAYAVAANAEDAALIANGANAYEIEHLTLATKNAEKATKDFAAATSISNKLLETAEKNALAAKLANDKLLTDAQKAAILNDADLARLYMTPTFDPNGLQKALTDASKAKLYEFNINKVTISGLQDIFQKGMTNATEAFSAQEKVIELNFKAKKNPLEDAIKAAKRAVEDIQNKPGGLNDLNADLQRISEKEKDINKAYDDKIKALDKVSQINDKIIAQQKSQLGLADALSRGDIAAAAAAAQDMRAQSVTGSIGDQKAILEEGRKSAIEGLTGQGGLTKDEIEQRVRDLNSQIFEIEQQRIEPLQRQLDLLDRQQQDQIDTLTVMGKTKDEWDLINANLDLANTKTKDFKQTMAEALFIVTGLTTALATGVVPTIGTPGGFMNGGMVSGYMNGGMVKYLAKGGGLGFKPHGTDKIPAMLSEGEFVIKKNAVDEIGMGKLAQINEGRYHNETSSNSVYNINVQAQTDASPDDIARVVMQKLSSRDYARVSGNRF